MSTVAYTQFASPEFAEYGQAQSGADINVFYAYAESIQSHEEPLLQYLSQPERERADKFIHNEDRLAFIGAHALMRICCGACLKTSPESLILQYQASGKPFFVSPDTGQHLHVSLSHCRAGVAAAFSRKGDIGVDIEQINPIFDHTDIAQSFFHPKEAAICRADISDRSVHNFYTCWTKKEAFIKATGEGLSRELGSFLVPEEDKGPVRNADGTPIESHWLVESSQLQNNIFLAVVYRTQY